MSETGDNRKGKEVRRGKAIVEYENLDLPPAYVEAAQGMPTPQGALHVSFYSERIGCLTNLEGQVEFNDNESGMSGMRIGVGSPFGVNGEQVRLIRRVEANLIFTPRALESLIPWLQQQLRSLQDPGDEK